MASTTNAFGLEVDEIAPHLGGFIKGGDPLSYTPSVWLWLIKEHGVQSVVDVGCGDGTGLRWWDTHGVMATGIDGIKTPGVQCHDYTKGPLTFAFTYDLAWSCEFVEHVERRYVMNFLRTFSCARLLAMTHAVPGQGGYHHVNEQNAAYWIAEVHRVGFRLDRKMTTEGRQLAAEDDPDSYFASTGLVFRR